MDSLVQISNALRDVVARVAPSVVSVRGRRACAASGLVWSENLVLTSARAFDREDELSVVVGDGQRSAQQVGVHPGSDLLALRVEGPLSPFVRATTHSELGELVALLARPGESLRARLGVISAAGGEWHLPGGARVERYLETDIAPTPALAGTALIAMDGSLVGINHPGIARGALVTLPASSIVEIVEQLSSHGRVRCGHLGVMVHPVRLPSALAKELGRSAGLMTLGVSESSPAERAGVLLGDVLLEFDGQPLARVDELAAALSATSIDRQSQLRVLRSGGVRSLAVKPEERPITDLR
jgi:serine protease Do